MSAVASESARLASTREPRPLARGVRAEWLRTKSVRTPWFFLLVAVLLPASGTASATLTFGGSGGIAAGEPHAVEKALSGGFSAGLIAMLFGIVAVTSEYRHGTAAMSIVNSVQRRTWLLSKVIVAVPIGLGLTIAGQLAVLAVGAPILASKGVSVDLWHGALLQMTLGTCTLGALTAAIGVGIGALVPNQLPAVIGAVIYSLAAETAILHYAPGFGEYLPGGAQASIVRDPTLQHLGAPAGYLVMLGWAVVALTAGLIRLNRQDVPAG